jgi:hypothetical protein
MTGVGRLLALVAVVIFFASFSVSAPAPLLPGFERAGSIAAAVAAR